jgi:flagellar biosynthesis protein FliP
MMAATPAAAQDIRVNFGQGNGLTERVIQMIALLTVLSLAPSILVMMTRLCRPVFSPPIPTHPPTARE